MQGRRAAITTSKRTNQVDRRHREVYPTGQHNFNLEINYNPWYRSRSHPTLARQTAMTKGSQFVVSTNILPLCICLFLFSMVSGARVLAMACVLVVQVQWRKIVLLRPFTIFVGNKIIYASSLQEAFSVRHYRLAQLAISAPKRAKSRVPKPIARVTTVSSKA